VSVPLENLHASKPPEDNADNAIKRMAAAAEGILSKRPPIDVRPRPLEPGHYDVVDGNGTLAAAKKAGLTDLPVNVVSPAALPTRIPAAKGMEQPLSNMLTTDLDSATTPPERASPKVEAAVASHFAGTVNALAREPGMEGASRFSTVGEKAEYIINRMKENLLALHDRMDHASRYPVRLELVSSESLRFESATNCGSSPPKPSGGIDWAVGVRRSLEWSNRRMHHPPIFRGRRKWLEAILAKRQIGGLNAGLFDLVEYSAAVVNEVDHDATLARRFDERPVLLEHFDDLDPRLGA
jgi:hypothetical protein